MASTNFKYNLLLKELVGQGLLSEELDDYTKTLIMHFKQQHSRKASKIEPSINLQLVKTNKSMEYIINDNITSDLLRNNLKETKEVEKVLEEIAEEDEKINLLTVKFDQLVNGFEEKIHSLDDKFSLENLNRELYDCSIENEIRTSIEDQLKLLNDDAQHLKQIQAEIPNIDNLKVIRHNLLTNNDTLQEKERQFRVLKQALNQMNLRLKDF